MPQLSQFLQQKYRRDEFVGATMPGNIIRLKKIILQLENYNFSLPPPSNIFSSFCIKINGERRDEFVAAPADSHKMVCLNAEGLVDGG